MGKPFGYLMERKAPQWPDYDMEKIVFNPASQRLAYVATTEDSGTAEDLDGWRSFTSVAVVDREMQQE